MESIHQILECLRDSYMLSRGFLVKSICELDDGTIAVTFKNKNL
ncbi:hypothetical protein [Dipodfec virus UA23Rod_1340]|uniref:Uncharacterized protein n=1 Tax=Dipodfec virus UA23Rod_1340 TaxID=2929330 RepID=A0A976R855_9VIRU|nr:hypothetical protein [Dipodfec virus UA23Rod_1340]